MFHVKVSVTGLEKNKIFTFCSRTGVQTRPILLLRSFSDVKILDVVEGNSLRPQTVDIAIQPGAD